MQIFYGKARYSYVYRKSHIRLCLSMVFGDLGIIDASKTDDVPQNEPFCSQAN